MQGGHPIGRARAALRALHRAQRSGDLETDLESNVDASGNLEDALLNADHEARDLHQRANGEGSEIEGRQPTRPALRRFQRAVSSIQQEQQVIKKFPSNRDRLASVFERGSLTMGTGVGLYSQAGKDKSREAPGVFAPRQDFKAIFGLIFGSWMNVLLICLPVGWLSGLLGWGSIPTFLLNFFTLVPLALILGEVTEDLAVRFGDTAGGLLNATFGNVTELILSIAALTKGLNVVVAMSLIGSVLSNMLLVLGMCFFCGGARFKEQSFSTMINKACCSLLFLTCIALSIPTAAHYMFGDEQMPQSAVEHMSRGTAIILIIVYACYLLFSLKTHNQAFESQNDDGDDEEEDDGDKHEEVPVLSLSGAFFLLASITVMVAVSSELLTGAVEDVSKKSGLNERFLGLIILPIAGNACEHITAIFVAVKNKMDLAIGVALGSSIQIACFVLPVIVLVGWAIGPVPGHKAFTLDFDAFITLILTLSVIHAYFNSADGNSNWLAGVQLCTTYLLIALLYLFIKDASDPPRA